MFSWPDIREKINIAIYNSKKTVIRTLRIFRGLGLIVAAYILIQYYGFPILPETKIILLKIIKGLFIFYFFSYYINLFYHFEPFNFFKSSWVEAMFLLFLMIQGIIVNYYPQINIHPLYIQLLLLILILIETGKASSSFSALHIGPTNMFVLSFFILIMGGAGLLMLPEMSASGKSMPFLDALFTSTSASCVTGLIVVDTATFFTFKGQIVIMLLIQMGGISILSFAAFFAYFARKSQGVKQQSIISSFLGAENLYETKGLLRRIIFFSAGIELIGTLLIFFLWSPDIHFSSWMQQVYYSMFHSVSAFNNAGFSLFTDNLYNPLVRNAYFIHLVIAALIFLGGIGFASLTDMFSVKNLRERLKHPWKQIAVGTKIAVYTSFGLIILGTIVFYLLEKNNTLAGKNAFECFVISLFQSVTPRTAGFNTVDYSRLGMPILFFMLFLMFVGASSGSTGGGIKTSTFAIVLSTVWSTIRGKKNVEMFRHTVTADLFKKALAILFFAVTVTFTGSLLLMITEPDILPIQILFEDISAFGTVGLSTGITPFMSDAGKLILILTMFIGRTGPLTLAFAMTMRQGSAKYRYSTANILVG
ncbi:MAG TPA: potassium transporter TrkG [Bacteroidales bacterium]|nr:potassium transporter TrkG [Bacteroidales bacterium]HPS17968.1 potassium transporter TrkG [Bacteroidales bacterium]